MIEFQSKRKKLTPVTSEALTSKEYLRLSRSSEVENIKHVHFESSKLGSGSFGKFIVEYKNPKLLQYG